MMRGVVFLGALAGASIVLADSATIAVRPGELASAIATARTAGKPMTLRLAAGVYESETNVVLTSRDRHLTFEGPVTGRAIISAGRRLTGWTVDGRGWWHVSVPAQTRFSQFFVNGERRTRPFLPRRGYYFIERSNATTNKVCESFYLKPGDFPAGDNPDLEFCLFQTWTMSRSPVVSYDAVTRLVQIGIRPFLREWDIPTPLRWYRIDNVKSALGEPGDWYLDTRANEVIYVPKTGETPANCETVASRHKYALFVDGAEDITFRNVVFAYGDNSMHPTAMSRCGQASPFLPAMVQVEHARGIRFEHCAFLHSGAYALAFAKGSADGAARDCEFFDLGAGGVRIGDGHEWNRKDPMVTGCTIEECLISGGGRVDPAGVGVWIGHSRNNRVAHCTIHDLYYSGISAGWNWCFNETARDNIFEWNHIYDIGQHVLSDMGGIYLLGRQPGTVERFNHIHHVTRARNCAFGVYFDSGTALVTVTNNYTHDCEDTNWFMARISASNIVENNVFASATHHQINVPGRDKSASPSRFVRNIVTWDDKSGKPFVYDPMAVHFESNLCWCSTGKMEDPVPTGFTFANPDCADLKSLGFQPFSLRGCGRRQKPRYTKGLPRPPAVFWEPPPSPSFPIDEGFEIADDGAKWPDWACSANIAVTSEQAYRGKKSIRFTDSLPSWNPHAFISVSRTEGRQRVTFALRIEKGAQPQFEVRDYTVGYGNGPEIAINGKGQLCARRGKVLCDFPAGVWVPVELEFELGPNRAADAYAVRVRLPGESEPREFAGLPISPKFRKVEWLGFMSNANNGTSYWVDDLKLVP